MDHQTLLASVRFNADGLVPAILQDAAAGEVLMLAYMNAEALARTLQTRRGALLEPQPRASSGTRARPAATCSACAGCSSTATTTPCCCCVEPAGPACHTGAVSCFSDAASGGAGTAP